MCTSQGRDNMIYLWQLPLLQEITTLQLISPDLISEIVYNGLSFCKLSSYQNKGKINKKIKKNFNLIL